MANISTIKVGTTSYGIEAAHATSAGCLKNAAGGVGIAGGSASTPVYFNTSGVPTSCTDGIFRSIVYFSTFTDLSSKVTTLRKQFSDSHSAANSNCYIIYPIYTGTATSGYLNLNNPNLGSLTISTYYTHVVLDFQFCERLYTTASINTPIIDVYDVSIQNLNLTVYDTSASTNTDFSKIKVSGGHCNFINNDISILAKWNASTGYYKFFYSTANVLLLDNNRFAFDMTRSHSSGVRGWTIGIETSRQNENIICNNTMVCNWNSALTSNVYLNVKTYSSAARPLKIYSNNFPTGFNYISSVATGGTGSSYTSYNNTTYMAY